MKALIKPLLVFNIALLSFATCRASAAPVTLETGEWKTTVQTDMSNATIPGLPAGIKLPAKPAMTYNWCYKPEAGKDLGQQLADAANHNNQGQKCEMLENKTSGNNVHYKMRCTGQQGEADIVGDFTVDSKKYDGKTQVQMNTQLGPMLLNSTIAGEYIGPCKVAPPKPTVAGKPGQANPGR